jgi:hypothetical protein
MCIFDFFLCTVIFPSIFFKESLVKKSQEQLKVGLMDRIQKNLLSSIDRALFLFPDDRALVAPFELNSNLAKPARTKGSKIEIARC